jgi:hypothetical protein
MVERKSRKIARLFTPWFSTNMLKPDTRNNFGSQFFTPLSMGTGMAKRKEGTWSAPTLADGPSRMMATILRYFIPFKRLPAEISRLPLPGGLSRRGCSRDNDEDCGLGSGAYERIIL